MAAALAGKDYFTLPQMMDIISQALKHHNVQWGHLDKTWDFTHIRGLMGVEFHRLRNAHSFAFTRTAAGITARWKQWLTDSTWSRPLTIVSAIQMRDFYRLRPPAEPRVFPEATASGILPSSISWMSCWLPAPAGTVLSQLPAPAPAGTVLSQLAEVDGAAATWIASWTWPGCGG